jgi:hypothetical protein
MELLPEDALPRDFPKDDLIPRERCPPKPPTEDDAFAAYMREAGMEWEVEPERPTRLELVALSRPEMLLAGEALKRVAVKFDVAPARAVDKSTTSGLPE